MRIKITSDGKPSGTRVTDLDSGQDLTKFVKRIVWTMAPRTVAIAHLEVAAVAVDVQGAGVFTNPDDQARIRLLENAVQALLDKEGKDRTDPHWNLARLALEASGMAQDQDATWTQNGHVEFDVAGAQLAPAFQGDQLVEVSLVPKADDAPAPQPAQGDVPEDPSCRRPGGG